MILAPSLPEAFQSNIISQQLFPAHARLVVAVSGGLDSVVLCRLLHTLGYPFVVAHCHFGLRQTESDRDADFVARLARQLDVPFYCRHFQTQAYAADNKCSIQEAARQLRYQWFETLRLELLRQAPAGAPAVPHLILTAHHQDDDIETLLLNFFKGTGIHGLKGMAPRRAHLVRPLLFARREQLERFALAEGLQWVEDSSNQETKYTRNFLRHEVLPLLAQKMPQVADNLAGNITRFREAFELYQQGLNRHLEKLGQQKGAELHIPVLLLARTQPLQTVAYELLQPYGFSPQQTPQVLQLLQSESGRFVQSATHQVVRHRKWLVVAPRQPLEKGLLVIEQGRSEVAFAEGQLHLTLSAIPASLRVPADTALMDPSKLQYPLVLRPWKTGDYFYPLGLGKKKKISRLLNDLKLSRTEKEKVYVLESGNRICWVVGCRADERFKIGPATREVLRCTVKFTG